jgi:xylulose-5-phosphate/fructose-6-phosphate phosphoketolase
MAAMNSTNEMSHTDRSLSAYGTARSTMEGNPLNPDELRKIDAYWRASLYLSMGMLYLKANPLLREPLSLEHTKPRLLGHWGSDPGQSFAYIHFNRLIKKYDLNAIYISGPGHGAPAVLSQAYLEGTYSEIYPDKSEDLAGMQRFFKQFSFPGGIGSHATPETPGSIHEGGELGYSISHAYGAVYDNPDLIALEVVGDGEAETGPLATSWHSNKFLNPITDGAVLPVLHLNGHKINNPTILARIGREELTGLFSGYGYIPYFVEGSDPPSMHQAMAATLEHCVLEIRKIQEEARQTGRAFRPRWPVVILRSPKGWTAPREVDGHMAPKSVRRMSANPIANGGLLRKPLVMPDFRQSAVKVEKPGATVAGNAPVLGNFVREVMRLNMQNFRVFGPDETQPVQEVSTVTLRCLRRHVPAAVPGIVFLSGGQHDREATVHLDAINRLPGARPWKLTFSYGRALQDHALEAWDGREENLAAGRQALYRRARCNSAASLGRYTAEMESTLLSSASPPHRRVWYDN